ncbi:hypothetical protein JTB14_017455 [Gonioctena quinquepunctata]|nr:hypothetical protein JTB14_017455 [Gonioctena quinquepunctata]
MSYRRIIYGHVDPDLVFDNLELTNSNHPRISIDGSHSSQAVEEEHWLTSAVNRMKRSIGSIFTKEPKHPENTNHIHHKAKGVHHKKAGNAKRKHRQAGDYENGPEEGEVEYDEVEIETGQEYADPDLYEDINSGDTFPGNGINDDDDYNPFSGDGSGEVPPIDVGTTRRVDYGHPRIFRFGFTTIEPYKEEFKDRNSPEFQAASSRIRRALEDVFADVPGEQFVTIVKLEPHPDPFKVKVESDIESQGNSDKEAIKQALYEPIHKTHRIGDLVIPDLQDLRFTEFGATGPKCTENEIRCNNGQCVEGVRCDTNADCSDNSDEEGCPTDGPIVEPVIPHHPHDNNIPPPTKTPTVPTTSTPSVLSTLPPLTPETEPPMVPEAEPPMAPETEPRQHPSRKNGQPITRAAICADQVCDGTPDCDDGGDERNCGECQPGEFKCDINRCIPLSQKCDGNSECSDGTDEYDCVKECAENEFKCDVDRCIPSASKCDRERDCQDNTDESNCEV